MVVCQIGGQMKIHIYIGTILLTIAMLAFAAILIFWKPGKKTKYRFVRLSLGNLLIHLADGLVTYVNTPDLKREANPLVSRLGCLLYTSDAADD